MKRFYFTITAISLSLLMFAQSNEANDYLKIDNLDDNKWGWLEEADKYRRADFDGEGHLVLTAKKLQKNASDYVNMAKTFVRLPIRPKEDYKVSIKCIAPKKTDFFTVFFNVPRKCMEDNDGLGLFSKYMVNMAENSCTIDVGESSKHTDKLPGKYKKNKEHPYDIVITKQQPNVIIEINGIQVYKGTCELTESHIGLGVPVKQRLLIDEVSVEQAEERD